jgi:hypothetical protein
VLFDFGSIAAAGGWAAFWLQLPATIVVIAAVVVGLAAILRARPEDVPAVFQSFAAFATAFGKRPTSKVRRILPQHRRSDTVSARPVDNTEESA